MRGVHTPPGLPEPRRRILPPGPRAVPPRGAPLEDTASDNIRCVDFRHVPKSTNVNVLCMILLITSAIIVYFRGAIVNSTACNHLTLEGFHASASRSLRFASDNHYPSGLRPRVGLAAQECVQPSQLVYHRPVGFYLGYLHFYRENVLTGRTNGFLGG